jgi:hypothetical protein
MWSGRPGRVRQRRGPVRHQRPGLPGRRAGSNDQGIILWFEANGAGAMIAHDDQFRGVQYSFAKGSAQKLYNFVNPTTSASCAGKATG